MSKQHLKKHHAKHAGTTDGNVDSLVKVVVTNDKGEWVRPNAGDKFYIAESAEFPEIVFEIKTDLPPPYDWEWKIEWNAHVSGLTERIRTGRKLKIFTETGKFSGGAKLWQADLNNKVVGGKLSVSVKAGGDEFKRTVVIRGKNPSKDNVITFLSTLHDVTGFDKLIEQESRFKNFINADEEPIVAGDSGYGMTQLTTPAPTFTQIWSWKENVRGEARLFQEKQTAAKHYLGQSSRPYTDEQLAMETISRWNGGGYHTWNGQGWERNAAMLCDSKTGNTGWDTSVAENQGKTEDELHECDKEKYSQMKASQSAEHPWKYSGVCYADHVENH